MPCPQRAHFANYSTKSLTFLPFVAVRRKSGNAYLISFLYFFFRSVWKWRIVISLRRSKGGDSQSISKVFSRWGIKASGKREAAFVFADKISSCIISIPDRVCSHISSLRFILHLISRLGGLLFKPLYL